MGPKRGATVNFTPKFLGLSVVILRNFWDCFMIVRAKFSRLFFGSLEMGSGLVLIL